MFFIYGLLNDTVSSEDCVVLNGRAISEQWTGKDVEAFVVLSWHLPGRIEKNHEKTQDY
jgi:hypothetical protein